MHSLHQFHDTSPKTIQTRALTEYMDLLTEIIIANSFMQLPSLQAFKHSRPTFVFSFFSHSANRIDSAQLISLYKYLSILVLSTYYVLGHQIKFLERVFCRCNRLYFYSQCNLPPLNSTLFGPSSQNAPKECRCDGVLKILHGDSFIMT